jgi:uncharacterized protein YsxB (DUF464 family)
MTTVLITKSAGKEYQSITCMGHAGFARKAVFTRRRSEFDMVCAAISILVLNTVNALDELAGETLKVTQDAQTGFLRCEFQGGLQEKSVFLLDAMVFGLEELSRTYGRKYLQVNFEEA